MTLEAPLLDFQNFKKLELIKKTEYHYVNKLFCEQYRVQQKDTGKIYTANISRPEETQKTSKTFNRVVNILAKLNYPSLLKFVGYSKINQDDISQSAVITEYFPNITLDDMIKSEKSGHPISGWNDTKKLISIYGIASGMAYLHSKNILHRNLKPEHILMDESFYPKIRGYNLLINCNDKSIMKPIKCSPEYMAPEIIMREQSSKPMDVYSFAMTIYEIITLNHPFEEIENLNVIHILKKVNKGEMPEFPSSTPKAFQDLIERCWAKNPEERPTFDEIVFLLRTDPEFISKNVNKEEYKNYINLLDESTRDEEEKEITNFITEEDEKVLKKQIQMKNEENKHLRHEIKNLKKKLHEEKEKLKKAIEQKEKTISDYDENAQINLM